MRIPPQIVRTYGPIVTHFDFRDYLMSTGLGKRQAYSFTFDALGQLLTRVADSGFICLICQQRRGVCRCSVQGAESLPPRKGWVYFTAPQRWVIERAWIMGLTDSDLFPLGPKTYQRLRGWQQHLRDTG